MLKEGLAGMIIFLLAILCVFQSASFGSTSKLTGVWSHGDRNCDLSYIQDQEGKKWKVTWCRYTFSLDGRGCTGASAYYKSEGPSYKRTIKCHLGKIDRDLTLYTGVRNTANFNRILSGHVKGVEKDHRGNEILVLFRGIHNKDLWFWRVR